MKRAKKLKRGVDWDAWAWQYIDDPFCGNKIDVGTVTRTKFEMNVEGECWPLKGRWVKVKIVVVDR